MSDDSDSSINEDGSDKPFELTEENVAALSGALHEGRMGFDPYTIDTSRATPLDVVLKEAEEELEEGNQP